MELWSGKVPELREIYPFILVGRALPPVGGSAYGMASPAGRVARQGCLAYAS